MIRTHEAGTLRASHAGEHVVLAGWVARRRDHGGVVFIDLRDASGLVQVVWRGEEAPSQEAGAHELRAEFCVLVTGTVRQRPAGNENPDLPSGQIRCPFPSRIPPRSARTYGSSTGTWTSGGPKPRRPSASARRPPTCCPT